MSSMIIDQRTDIFPGTLVWFVARYSVMVRPQPTAHMLGARWVDQVGLMLVLSVINLEDEHQANANLCYVLPHFGWVRSYELEPVK